jgi:hypothetical protein
VQGDVTERLEDFFTKDLKDYPLDVEKVKFEDGGNKKTKK